MLLESRKIQNTTHLASSDEPTFKRLILQLVSEGSYPNKNGG